MLHATGRVAALLLCGLMLCAATAPPDYVNFSVPPVDQVMDLHGDPAGAQLVIFMAGNQYMVVPALLSAFQKRNPGVRAIFYETLPPGIVIRQVQTGALRMGALVVTAKPDVLLLGPRGMRTLRTAGKIAGWHAYASNTLAILVRAGNPLHITTLADLGRSRVRVVMPNPKWEGVAEQVEGAYRKAGGAALVQTIMKTKLAGGTTILTRIHHRETPLCLLSGRADAGPLWLSEALYQRRLHGFGVVRIPQQENVHADYEAAISTSAAHVAAARAFVSFIQSAQARAIFIAYGFGPPR
ncbi:MAG TPA: substrate-binding domain-containing protein [Candidatus Baltobacteraceae bacterium]